MKHGKRTAWVGLLMGLTACGSQSGPWQQVPVPPVAAATLLRTALGNFNTTAAPGLALEDVDGNAALACGARGLFLVRVADGRAQDVRRLLVGVGAVVHGWFPDDAWSIGATAQQVSTIAALEGVQSVSALPVSLKLEQSMLTPTHRGLALVQTAPEADLWVELAGDSADVTAGGADNTAAAAADVVTHTARTLGGTVETEGRELQVLRVRVPSSAVATLASMPEVLAMEPYTVPQTTNDVSFGVVQSGHVGDAPFWDHGLRGEGQMVGLSDSGVDTRSCYFAGDKVAGYLEFTNLHDGDGSGHGTHVAGSIAGNMGGDQGVHPHDGMAPAARLFVEDVGVGENLVGIPGDLSALFGPAYNAGARIHSNSWAAGSSKYGVMARALDRFVAAHPDFLPLFAAGNAGRRGTGTVLEPATAKNVVAVGAMDGAHPNTMAKFSSRGPTLDGRLKPTIVAPGVAVVSAAAGTACGTRTLSGTSMATPTAAGAVALARQYFVEGWYPGGAANAADALEPSAALLKATLMAGAVDMSQERGAQVPGQGFGRMQLDRVLMFDAMANRLWLHDDAQGLDDAQTITFTVHVHAGDAPLRVALAWTDPPALPGAGHALVNDLDLEVTDPAGVSYRGHADAVDSETAPDGARDADNVEERVAVSYATAGDWQITVRGSHVPMGPQTFALVAVGDFAR